jgi:hypothetical protein
VSEPHWCPIDGCDYGGEGESLAAVRSHVNSTTDETHTWGDVKQQVEQQKADGEQTETDETDDPDDQEETSDNQQDDQQQDQQDMPDDDEYRQQHSGDDQGGDADDDTGDQDVGDSDDDGEWSMPIPSLDGTTMMMLIGVLAVLVLLYLVFVRDGSDDVVSDADVTEDSDDTEAVDGEEVPLIE